MLWAGHEQAQCSVDLEKAGHAQGLVLPCAETLTTHHAQQLGRVCADDVATPCIGMVGLTGQPGMPLAAQLGTPHGGQEAQEGL